MTNSNGAQELTYVLLAEDDDDDYLIFSLAVNDITSVRVELKRAENGDILMSHWALAVNGSGSMKILKCLPFSAWQ